jgi:phosphatidylglycerol:prolipoprotein diacylglycerol transferase
LSALLIWEAGDESEGRTLYACDDLSRREPHGVIFPISTLSFTSTPWPCQIGPLAIRWYALAYVAGILLGWRYAVAWCKQSPAVGRPDPDRHAGPDRRPGAVDHPRHHPRRPLGYILFYDTRPAAGCGPTRWRSFKVWDGGMSSTAA